MPNFSRLKLKPSPREFDGVIFRQYVDSLKSSPVRSRLFALILKGRDFDEIRRLCDTEEQAALEINQCLIEALDIALNTPENSLDAEFEAFSQRFTIQGRDSSRSALVTKNKIYF